MWNERDGDEAIQHIPQPRINIRKHSRFLWPPPPWTHSLSLLSLFFSPSAFCQLSSEHLSLPLAAENCWNGRGQYFTTEIENLSSELELEINGGIVNIQRRSHVTIEFSPPPSLHSARQFSTNGLERRNKKRTKNLTQRWPANAHPTPS